MAGPRERVKTAILKALHDFGGPVGASRLVDRLADMGIDMRPRTVRFYLLQLDGEGMTQRVSRRRGRTLTARGMEELAHANVAEKVGFIAARVDALAYRMTLNTGSGLGSIITNVGIVRARDTERALRRVRAVIRAGLGMGDRVALAHAGNRLGAIAVPAGRLAIGTVCSVTLNGVLLDHGIPVTSRYGGLLEVHKGTPVRFVELIDYRGTTLDPLEAFIRADMTQVERTLKTGTGIIGASFREVPSVALPEVRRLHNRMVDLGLGGILALGKPNMPLLDVPVTEGRTGIAVAGGLNPIAAVRESGIDISVESLADLVDMAAYKTVNQPQPTDPPNPPPSRSPRRPGTDR